MPRSRTAPRPRPGTTQTHPGWRSFLGLFQDGLEQLFLRLQRLRMRRRLVLLGMLCHDVARSDVALRRPRALHHGAGAFLEEIRGRSRVADGDGALAVGELER